MRNTPTAWTARRTRQKARHGVLRFLGVCLPRSGKPEAPAACSRPRILPPWPSGLGSTPCPGSAAPTNLLILPMRYPEALSQSVPRIGVCLSHRKTPPGKRPRRVNCPRPWELVAKLNRAKALRLRFQEGLSYRQIAHRLGCSKTTAHRYI